MNIPSAIRPFWQSFQVQLGQDVSSRFYEAFHFDDNEKHANLLAELVMQGTKRATAGLLWSFEQEKKPLPVTGALSVVTNWQAEPLCIIETSHVAVVPFEDVTEHFAATEGEGDKTLRFWREVHWAYFSRECERISKVPSMQMPVVCEEFSLVYIP